MDVFRAHCKDASYTTSMASDNTDIAWKEKKRATKRNIIQNRETSQIHQPDTQKPEQTSTRMK